MLPRICLGLHTHAIVAIICGLVHYIAMRYIAVHFALCMALICLAKRYSTLNSH